MAASPLKQFEVTELATVNLGFTEMAFTNHSLWVVLATSVIALLFIAGTRNMKTVPGKLQSFVEMTYDFVQDMVQGTTGAAGMAYMPLIMTLFLFIAFMNLFGMIPGSYTATSQIFTTGLLAVAVFALVVIIGFWKHGLKFFGLFLPEGTPAYLVPLIIPLEIISFLARPLTLAVRLAANMVAGHVLLKVFALFATMMAGGFLIGTVGPLFALVAISALEVFIALLQAYIFTVLTCVYLNDALHLH